VKDHETSIPCCREKRRRRFGAIAVAMVAIFIWFGIKKFTPYAAEAIEPLISHSPFI
jgi:reactive chlorine resistance protein C